MANFVLDLAEAESVAVSNLSINKIVFFLHAYFLVQFGKPLVTAKIEAWQHGPVFRELYREFKAFGDQPITTRANRMSPESGLRELCNYDFSDAERQFLERITKKYARLSSGALRAMSHEKDGPWDQVWNHVTRSNASMNISNEIIKDWYERAARH
ncbi:MAG TPA: type II toxin-antitoxin system antitoxin SocA domain-containing protein [Xanthobacteraceae bacterium]|nr:type II toxin-antitoxin system antitoxin SocA domain-containing protein [Xanthobacteraceae bacterium]